MHVEFPVKKASPLNGDKKKNKLVSDGLLFRVIPGAGDPTDRPRAK